MKNLAQNLGLSLLVTLLTIVLLEAGLPVVMPHWVPYGRERVDFWQYDSLLGWSQKPDQHGTFTMQDFSVTVSTNSLGLRDGEYPLHRVEGKKRMLVLGDSFGWGFGVEAHESFPKLLESRNPDWEVINACVSGYGTDQEILYYRERGSRFHPDAVLLEFCDNDIDENYSSAPYWYNKPVFRMADHSLELENVPVPKATIKQRLERFLVKHTTFLAHFYFSVQGLYRSVAWWTPAEKLPGVAEQKLEVTAMLLRMLQSDARKRQSPLYIVSVPMSSTNRELVHNVAVQEGIPYLSLDSTFAQRGAMALFEHDTHWNAVGHRLAADAIEDFLHQHEVLR